MDTSATTRPFRPFARLLHWLMTIAIVAMLFIGLGMVSTAQPTYSVLLAIHRPLGIAVLLLAIVRLAYRLGHKPPPLPADLPALQVFAAHASHWALYGLMLAMPLVGWAMLSAGGYPIVMTDSWHLPPILPVSPMLFAWLRTAHSVLALLLVLTFLAHLGAALFHGLIRRDGVLSSMRPWPVRRPAPPTD